MFLKGQILQKGKERYMGEFLREERRISRIKIVVRGCLYFCRKRDFNNGRQWLQTIVLLC